MLTFVAIGKAVAIPILLAVALVSLMRRSANAWCLLAAFCSGMLGAFSLNQSVLRNLPAILPENQLQVATTGEAWLSAFVEAAIPEELSKGIWIIVFLIGWSRYSSRHGALIGGLVGLGFALRENLSYAQTVPEWRVFGALSHCEWGVIMGSLLQHAIINSSRRARAIAWGFIAPILLHGLLDTSVFLVEAHESQNLPDPSDKPPAEFFSLELLSAMLLTLVVEIVSLAWAIRMIRRVWKVPVADPVLDSPAE